MTLQEFERQLGQYGQEVGNLDQGLQQLFSELVTEIRAAAPVATGQLMNSIKLTGDRFHFEIKMNYYGVFQNYGVRGTTSSRIPVNVPEAGLSFGAIAIEQERFQFGTGNFDRGGRPWGAYYSGIRARSFFSITDITNELTEFIQDNTQF